MLGILQDTVRQVGTSLLHNWPFLLIGALLAALIREFVDERAIGRFLRASGKTSVLVATAVAVLTPLCSCGTMAVVLAMMAGAVPWAPIVAFMAASPLTSPGELLVSAGLFGWPFAIVFLATSVGVGVLAGLVAGAAERRGLLNAQVRVTLARNCACGDVAGGTVSLRRRLPGIAREVARAAGQLMLLFVVFSFVGYFLNSLIPSAWVAALFGSGNRMAVPLAALLGLPLYFNTETSLPLIRAFVDNGATAGAALAFLVTGAGTSTGAIVGALAIARWRVIALVVGALFVGAVVAGSAFDVLAPVVGSLR